MLNVFIEHCVFKSKFSHPSSKNIDKSLSQKVRIFLHGLWLLSLSVCFRSLFLSIHLSLYFQIHLTKSALLMFSEYSLLESENPSVSPPKTGEISGNYRITWFFKLFLCAFHRWNSYPAVCTFMWNLIYPNTVFAVPSNQRFLFLIVPKYLPWYFSYKIQMCLFKDADLICF